MKTVLLIDSWGMHYFQRSDGQWRHVAGPSPKDTLWVLVNLPDELLEVIDLPRIYGRDRKFFLERRLAAAFPENICRVSHLLSGGLINHGKVMLTGLKSAKGIVDRLATLDAAIAGLWGGAALLTMMVKRITEPDFLVIQPTSPSLRILVFKDRLPVLTRHVHCDDNSIADEILLTRNYLKNQRIFERDVPVPVLFLGDASTIADTLVSAGLNLLSVPKGFLPKGEAGWLHPFFNKLVSSPSCQLAPLSLRSRYLSRNVRWAAYAGAVLSLGAGGFYGQTDLRAVMALNGRTQILQFEMQQVAGERDRLSALIKKSGADPVLVRRATQFAAEEITAAPGGDAFLPLAAAAIAEVPEARVQTLSFHLAAKGEGVCRHPNGSQSMKNQAEAVLPPAESSKGSMTVSLRQAEIQLAIKLPVDLSPRARTEARKKISSALRGVSGANLLQDPVFAAHKAILTGGAGVDTGSQGEERWCLSVPWTTSEEKRPAVEGEGAL